MAGHSKSRAGTYSTVLQYLQYPEAGRQCPATHQLNCTVSAANLGALTLDVCSSSIFLPTLLRQYPSTFRESYSAMSKGLKVIRDLSKGVASRTVQVTVVPTPVKFQERRAVLHALQKIAHIEVFQKLDVSTVWLTLHRWFNLKE